MSVNLHIFIRDISVNVLDISVKAPKERFSDMGVSKLDTSM